MLIYKSIENSWDKKIKMLGLTVYRRRLVDIYNEPYCEHKYLKGLFKIIENKNEKSIYIIGIRVAKYNKTVTYQMIDEIIATKTKMIKQQLDDVYWDMYVLSKVPYLHKHFEKYKRSNEGKNLVIVATGPSASFYKQLIPNAVHIGINAAIHFDWIKHDFVFVNDEMTNNPTLNDEIDNYRKDSCQKFYAIHSRHRLEKNRKDGLLFDKIAQHRIYDSNAKPYVLQDARTRMWAINLECEPIGDIGSTTFSALQFACYTHPQKIYLVGCDASFSFSESANRQQNYNHLMQQWLSFADFVKRTYPEIEIISLNPVGLKGLFKDIYTKDYIDEYLTKQNEVLVL